MAEIKLPPPTRGIDNRSDDTALPKGAVRDARNVDISRDGIVHTRRGGRLAIAAPGLHSVHASHGGVYGVQSGQLCRLDPAAGTIHPIAALWDDNPVRYADTPLGVAMVSPTDAGLIVNDRLMPLAPEDGRRLSLEAVDTGTSSGLAAGEYGVAYAYVIGQQEGALSPVARVEIETGQAIRIAQIPTPDSEHVDRVNIYRTTANGTTYYQCGEAMPGGDMRLGATDMGRPADTRHLAQIGQGDDVCLWNGRLVVTQGRTLLFSEPMRYGLCSPRFGFIQRPAPIRMVAATDGALFIGTDTETLALTGRRPDDWQVSRVDCGLAVAGSSATVALDTFSGEWASTSAQGAVWLSDRGYVVGMPDGTVLSPQARQLAIDTPGSARTAVVGRRLYSG